MGEIKASPEASLLGIPGTEGWLSGLSRLLRKGKELAKPAEDLPFPVGPAVKAGQMLTEGMPEGLESWSYGDRMFGPKANAPLVNERTGNMLSVLPLGTAAQTPGAIAKTASLLPAVAKFYKATDPLRAMDIERRVTLADKMRKGGASAEQIGEATDLFMYPGHSGPATPPSQAKYGFRIEPGKWGTLNPDERRPITDVLEHPELFRLLPALKKMEVTTGSAAETPIKGLGHFDTTGSGISPEIAIANSILRTPGIDGAPGVAEHELIHGVNYFTDQHGSMGFGMRPLNDEALNKLPQLAEELAKNPETAQLADMLRSGRMPAWGRSAGEHLSEAGRKLMYTPDTSVLPQIGKSIPDNISMQLGDVLHGDRKSVV